jgi:hypothetical protein
MIEIFTKQIKKTWYCGGTLDGYDVAFDGKTPEEAQLKMKEYLKTSKEKNINWTPIKYYSEPSKESKLNYNPFGIGFVKPFLDINPFG